MAQYYIFVTDGKVNGYGCCQCTSENTICVEATKEMCDNITNYGNFYYIYENGELVVNPDWEDIYQQKLKDEKNQEIDQKIKELQEMSLQDVLEGNKENIDLYLDVINGLEMSRPNIQ